MQRRHYEREDYALKKVTTRNVNHNKPKNELINCKLTVINKNRITPACKTIRKVPVTIEIE